MPATPSPHATADPAYHKTPGSEPLPGYVLLEPLGRGGYGEVWKCEAPGGLLKAIKFVAAGGEGEHRDETLLRQEFEAFQQVKAIRHPFLLCLERVELVDGELVMVMGLADRHIGDRFNECRTQGLPGIPRDELLGYLREAAEALDVIGAQYGLQHLDVKPANLFLTAGHLQVGDYGLVSKLDDGSGKNRGLTPKYAAPEVLRGRVHTRSDQYSLALVYYELLTGAFPFTGRTPQQMMMQHVSVPPDLSALAEAERRPVGMALAKNPDERYPSCRDFIDAIARCRVFAPRLSTVTTVTPRSTPSGSTTAGPRSLPPGGLGSPSLRAQPPLTNPPTHRPFASDSTKHGTGLSLTGVPRLVGVQKPPPPTPARTALADTQDDCVSLTSAPRTGIRLAEVLAVVPVARLMGEPAPAARIRAEELAQTVLAAAGGTPDDPLPGDIVRTENGTWACRFATTIDSRMAVMKLALVREEFRIACETADERRVVFREAAPTGLFGGGKKSGFEVAVELPEPGNTDVVVTAGIFGKPPTEFARGAESAILRLMEAVRTQLNNVHEKRRHARVPAAFAVSLFPLHSDNRIDDPIDGRTVDVSAGGLAVLADRIPPCKYLYVAFEEVRGLRDVAILVRTIRRKEQPDGTLLTGTYQAAE